MPTVYVSGPMTTGDIAMNFVNAIETADKLWALGFVPFVPHLMVFYELQCHHTYEEWMDYDFLWLEKCGVLYRMNGESEGADREVKRAEVLGIPVYYDMEVLAADLSRFARVSSEKEA